ncbi:MAG: DUF2306 domain-containing protein, partial [Gammaproteobacteria bacterium]|nr:DUF2306 domain-containing protein [Gammaproteobacteria bacterium]
MSIQQTILFAHIASGTIALIAGAAALIFRKGARLHRQTGNIFFVSMLAMSATGAYLAYTIGVTLSIVSGILTFYLTATAWMTVKRKPGEIDALEYGAFVVVLAVTVACFALAVNARS